MFIAVCFSPTLIWQPGADDPVSGNLASKNGASYIYGDANHKHAVTSVPANNWSFQYDANGDMTQRVKGGTYNLSYDAENRLTGVSGAATANYLYDGDGNRTRATEGITTTYLGSYFEWTGSVSTMKKYYYAGAVRVAMRVGSQTSEVFRLRLPKSIVD